MEGAARAPSSCILQRLVLHICYGRARCREGRLGIRAEKMVERGMTKTSVRFGQAQGRVWGWLEPAISYEAEGLARATGRFNATMWWPNCFGDGKTTHGRHASLRGNNTHETRSTSQPKTLTVEEPLFLS
jgi:hypothetical protein